MKAKDKQTSKKNSYDIAFVQSLLKKINLATAAKKKDVIDID